MTATRVLADDLIDLAEDLASARRDLVRNEALNTETDMKITGIIEALYGMSRELA